MEVLKDFSKYESDPDKYDYTYYHEPIKWPLTRVSKYNKNLAEYNEYMRIRQSPEKIKEWWVQIHIWDKIYIFKNNSIGKRLQEEFLWEYPSVINEIKFNEILEWMNHAKVRQNIKIQSLVKDTTKNVDTIIGTFDTITVYSLITLMVDSSVSIWANEQTDNWSMVSGGGWDFAGGWATWDMGSVSTDTSSSWSE